MKKLTRETALMRTLDVALSLRRPHGSAEVAQLLQWLIEHLPEHLSCSMDGAGNLHIDARTDTHHRTLFVAHLDSVHRSGGVNKIEKTQMRWTAAMKDQCLGADDGAGVAMLMHLMHNDVPGYYVFTQGEECGGIGATFLAKHDEVMLLEHDRAIAFDRKGIDSVITHQAWGRCCSDTFAHALGSALNDASKDLLFLAPDDTGIYTDTAEFVSLIPECTNISIGYEHAHSDKETLDLDYFKVLAEAVLRIDWDTLPTERDPSVVESKSAVYDWAWNDAWSQDVWLPKATHASRKERKAVEYGPEDELSDAIDDAFYGNTTPLINMMAESVYPEDPNLAKKQIRTQYLSEDTLLWAEEMLSDGLPVGEILESLFGGVSVQ